MFPNLRLPQNLAPPLRTDLVYTISRVNHGLTQLALVEHLIVLTSPLSRCFSRKQQDKVQKAVAQGASWVRPWLTRIILYTGLFLRGCARFGGDQRLGTINGAHLTPGHLLALLQTLHAVHEMHRVG